MLKIYRIMAKNSLRELFTFRFDAFSKLVAFPIQLTLMFFLWKFVISEVDSRLNLEYFIGYYSFILVLSVQYPFIRLANEIQNKVITGDCFRNFFSGISLTKEYFVDFYIKASWFNIVSLPVALLIYHFTSEVSVNFGTLLFFILHVQLGSLILFFIWMLVGLAAFKLVLNQGLSSLIFNLQRLCIGSIIPLSFLPDTAQMIIKWTPFPYAFHNAIEIYIKGEGDSVNLLIYQIIWLFLMVCVCIVSEKYLSKKYEMVMV